MGDHLMVDIETMGKGPNGAIFQIGACLFDLDGVNESINIPIDLASSVRCGMELDASTIEFWVHHAEVYLTIKDLREGNTLHDGLVKLCSFVDHWERLEGVWSNAPVFDFGILRSAFGVFGDLPPWSHRQERCSRTILYSVGSIDEHVEIPERTSTRHDAEADAIYQAEVLIALLKQLGVA